MYKRLLVAAACIFLALAACDMTDSITDIQAGTATFQVQSPNSGVSTQNFEYLFGQTFSATPRVALALTSFSVTSANFKSWDIVPSQISKSSARIQFQQEPQYWVSAKVQLFASARQDLIIGNQMATFNPVKGSNITFSVNLNTQISEPNGMMSKVYLTGYQRLSGNSMDIRAMSTSISVGTMNVVLETGSDLQINSVRVNYIMFNPAKVGFQAYGGPIAKNQFTGSIIDNLQKNLHSSKYIFYGAISLKSSVQGAFNLNTEMISPLYVKFSSSRSFDSFMFYFIIIGVSNQVSCAKCQQKYMYNKECVASCPSDSYLVTYPNNSRGCRICPSQLNMVVNTAKNDCTCAPGHKLENGECVGSAPVVNTQTISTASVNLSNQNIIPNRAITQSYDPSIGVNNAIPQVAPTPVQPAQQTQQPKKIEVIIDCTQLPNSYAVGNKCVCKVGYAFQNGICVKKSLISDPNIFKPAQFIYRIPYIYSNQKPTCDKPNQYYREGQGCYCLPGFKKSSSGDCITDLYCPPNSQPQNGACICNEGYAKKGEECVLVSKCPPNSGFNGIQCVCNDGYYKQNGECIKGQPCPAYSQRKNGVCVCLPGYSMNNYKCTRCPEGQVYIPSENKCVLTCGINEFVNSETKKCECKDNFGKYEGICNICPQGFFLLNKYCVVCPIGSTYDEKNSKCICGPGLLMHSSGYCRQKCSLNQYYHAASDSCRCVQPMGRVNGICQMCPSGNFAEPTTQICSSNCGTDEIQQNGKCICKPGFGRNQNGKCADCSITSGSFLIDGYCATCPYGQVIINNKCSCSQGQKLINYRCQDSCQPGQLQDYQGNCYFCPLNQIIINGKCQCRQGYILNGFICEQKCKDTQILINGRCAICALNTIYDVNLKACVCPPGFYMNNKGICVQSILPPIGCPSGKYYDPVDGCLTCPSGCSQCKNANTCTKCSKEGFVPSGNKCVAQCGNGLISGAEQCDDKNNKSGDGCSSECKIEPNYKCSGQPSICVVSGPVCGDGIITSNEDCDDNNKNNGDGCSQLCKIQSGYTCKDAPSVCKKNQGQSNYGMKLDKKIFNFSNIFTLIRTDKAFKFDSDSEMRSFMKYSFPNPGTQPNSVFCLQESYDPQLFRCMVIYSSGVPNFAFKINFSFNHKGEQGFLTVDIDPTASVFQTRSLA